MATDTMTPRAEARLDGGPFVQTTLPALCLAILLIALGAALFLGIRALLDTEITATHEQHFVFRRLEDPLYLGVNYPFWRGLATAAVVAFAVILSARFLLQQRRSLREGSPVGLSLGVLLTFLGCAGYLLLALWLLFVPGGPGYLWLHLLIPILIMGMVYIACMYGRDSGAVGGLWAIFLAALRGTVYAVLGLVFLLPAWQKWEKNETHSIVVGMGDVSDSMKTRDDLPTESTPPEKLPSRQDKVIRFLTDAQVNFLGRIQEKNPLTLYRFGSVLDEEAQVLGGGKVLSEAEWSDWLKPDPREPIPDGLSEAEKETRRRAQELKQQLVGGTSLGDVLLAAINREANNMVQGIIVVSDGRSTQYSAQAFDELRARARKAKVPIFTVAVGEHRLPINIRITDLQAPEQAQPDDKFPVRVEVDGEGLPNKEVMVYLDVTSPTGDKTSLLKTAPFNAGSGGPPHAQAEFEIDAAELGKAVSGSNAKELEEGEWVFRARVPRDKHEVFLEREHLSDKATVQVVKKPLRVLLFAGAATRDFQFVRTMLVREVDRRRAELSVCLQLQRLGVVQDVPADRLLRQFPYLFQADDAPVGKAEERYYNLAQYDLIIAFDPDWSLLEPEQLALLEKWVGTHAGGLIVIGGPVNTYQLARPGNREKLKSIIDLYPVILQDSRLQGLGLDRPTTEPWRLHFPGATSEMEFLKLEDEAGEPLAAWEKFFTGQEKADQNVPIQRGFYNFYPVENVKPSGTAVATFADPRARLGNGQEQPYIVTMPYGSGRVVYLGAGETWRLRQYREMYHERFWTKLARYAGSGNLSRLSRRGVLVMGREFTAGRYVRLEAQLFGRDLQPLGRTAVPHVHLKPPTGVTMPTTLDLQPKPTQGAPWNGWFQGRFLVNAPGEYRLELQIPETGDTLPGRFLVKEANPELDNTRPDFGQLYQLASEAAEVLPRIKDKQIQNEVLQALEATSARLLLSAGDQGAEAGRRDVRLSTTERRDGKESPGKDQEAARLFFDLSTARLIPYCMVADSKVQKSRGDYDDLWDQGFTLAEHGPFDSSVPVWMSYLLLAIVALLSIEWLTRKLLKLA